MTINQLINWSLFYRADKSWQESWST